MIPAFPRLGNSSFKYYSCLDTSQGADSATCTCILHSDSMKSQGVFLLSPKWDASSSQGYPQQYICQYPFIHLDGESWHYESYVSVAQGHNTMFPARPVNSNPEFSICSGVHLLHEATTHLPKIYLPSYSPLKS